MNRYILNRYKDKNRDYILKPDANCTWNKKKKRKEKETETCFIQSKHFWLTHVKTSNAQNVSSLLERERETKNTNDSPLFAYCVLFYDSSFYDKRSDIDRQNSRARRRNDATRRRRNHPLPPGASDSIEREKREKVRELTNVHNQHDARSV